MTTAYAPAEVSQTQNKKRIRVRYMPYTFEDTALKELQGSRFTVFRFVWKMTVGYKKFDDRIAMSHFTDALPDSDRTIYKTLQWLKDNGWITIAGPERGIKTYGIPEHILEFSGCLGEEARCEETSEARCEETSDTIDLMVRSGYTTNHIVTTSNGKVGSDGGWENFFNSKEPGISYEMKHRLMEDYAEVYSPKVVERFVEYANMFKLSRKVFWSFFTKYDVLEMVRVARNMENEMNGGMKTTNTGGLLRHRIIQHFAEVTADGDE